MANEVKWIKIVTDIFDDEKILMIETLPESDTILVIWFKLLCLAGKQNNSGVFKMGHIPYTEEMFATIFRRPLNTVRLALKTFSQFGMVEIENGVTSIPNWGKHQNLEQLEERRRYQREYQQEYRKKQKLIASSDSGKDKHSRKHLRKHNVNTPEEDIEKELESELEEDISMDSNESICCTRDVQRVVDAWNALGLNKIQKITTGTNRYDWLKKRIKDYGIDKVLEAIENIRKSDFLQGKTKEGFKITFDWFIRPNNFPKVLDGNYDNRPQRYGKKTVPMGSGQLGEAELEAIRQTLQAPLTMPDPDPELETQAEAFRKRLEELGCV